MEHQIELRPSLLLLNEDCLLYIFELLQLKDSINLAETCVCLSRVCDRIFRSKYSTFELDESILNKGHVYVDQIMFYICKHVSTLSVSCEYLCLTVSKFLKACRNMKNLRIESCRGIDIQNNLYSHDINVELLTLVQCNFYFARIFLRNCSNLKHLNITYGDFKPDELKMVFENNPNIDSFVFHCLEPNLYFNCQLLQLIPKIQGLDICGGIENLNSLLKLDQLTKLRLDLNFSNKNVNTFLSASAKKGIIEEIELYNVEINDNFLDLVKSLDKLKLLVIETCTHDWYRKDLSSSTKWPSKLTQIQLGGFILKYNDIIEMIEQLNWLQSIELAASQIYHYDKSNFRDISKLSQHILNIIDHRHRNQQLVVVLPQVWPYADSGILVDLNNLRILRGQSNQLKLLYYYR